MTINHEKCQINVSTAITEFLTQEPPYAGEGLIVDVCSKCKKNLLFDLKLIPIVHLINNNNTYTSSVTIDVERLENSDEVALVFSTVYEERSTYEQEIKHKMEKGKEAKA